MHTTYAAQISRRFPSTLLDRDTDTSAENDVKNEDGGLEDFNPLSKDTFSFILSSLFHLLLRSFGEPCGI